MTDRKIIFSCAEVLGLLHGDKTQARRRLSKSNSRFDGGKWPNYLPDASFQWDHAWVDEGPSPAGNPGPYLKLPVDHLGEELINRVYPTVQPGDRLWVREAWRSDRGLDRQNATEIAAVCLDAGYSRVWAPIFYEVDAERVNFENGMVAGRYRHARFMPRWASRLTLTITEVRVQRLQEISHADALAEGCDAALALSMKRPNGAHPGNPRACFMDLWNSLHGDDAWDANPWVVAVTFTVAHGNIDQIGGGQ